MLLDLLAEQGALHKQAQVAPLVVFVSLACYTGHLISLLSTIATISFLVALAVSEDV
jgi:hypothetical protein